MKNSNCKCGKKHKSVAAHHKCLDKQIGKSAEHRGHYGEIIGWGKYTPPQNGKMDRWEYAVRSEAIIALYRDCLTEEYCEFDRKGRGSALNHDLYGYDPKQGVAVIQARQCIGSKYGKSTRKTYFLCGHNENGNPFVHPVSSHQIRAAVNHGANSVGVVFAAQKWMWEVSESQLDKSIRQGDLLLVPEKVPAIPAMPETVMTIAESHEIHADEIRKNGRVYAMNPKIIHTKEQHEPITAIGWFSVRMAREAEAWDFAERRGD